ncbi:GIY-YIG nuclease family protein [Burkholderia pseudomultivorans]|uniref:GIY-YIG nuclease family protein n=1 Tax=Burkholderia pseudomultivorans TaxID=1207504 RepID=UPI002874CA18|nr:GIY-YIG nuclease family protein [Burkholderia pseudomultivorans]MDS0859719.1 GIY-YIG nuclease family protein [Burkholderia pseudomultivorans]
MSWFLYLIECADDSVYTGITTDVAARFDEHAAGKGARYTRSRKPRAVLASFPLRDRSIASRAEYWVKRLTPVQKRELAAGIRTLESVLPVGLLADAGGDAAETGVAARGRRKKKVETTDAADTVEAPEAVKGRKRAKTAKVVGTGGLEPAKAAKPAKSAKATKTETVGKDAKAGKTTKTAKTAKTAKTSNDTSTKKASPRRVSASHKKSAPRPSSNGKAPAPALDTNAPDTAVPPPRRGSTRAKRPKDAASRAPSTASKTPRTKQNRAAS